MRCARRTLLISCKRSQSRQCNWTFEQTIFLISFFPLSYSRKVVAVTKLRKKNKIFSNRFREAKKEEKNKCGRRWCPKWQQTNLHKIYSFLPSLFFIHTIFTISITVEIIPSLKFIFKKLCIFSPALNFYAWSFLFHFFSKLNLFIIFRVCFYFFSICVYLFFSKKTIITQVFLLVNYACLYFLQANNCIFYCHRRRLSLSRKKSSCVFIFFLNHAFFQF